MAERVVFKYGTRAQYDAASKSSDTLYFLTDTGEMYRGTVGLGQPHHFEGIRTANQSDADAIAAAVGGAHLVKDDVCVIKTLISEPDNYSFKAFVYGASTTNGALAWRAMDGNYNAEQVYFDQDLIFTHNIGTVTVGSSGSQVVETTGKNVKEVLEMLFSDEKDPSVTKPTVSVNLAGAKAYEVGTTVTAPTYSITFNEGNYQYDSTTGVQMTSVKVTDSLGVEKTTNTGSFADLIVQDNTNYKLSVTAAYNAGATPNTNLGNPVPALAISAGAATATSGAITGYRNLFIGGLTASQVNNSASIRGLMAKKNGNMTVTYEAKTVPNAQRILVAIPEGTKTLKSVILISSQNADITGEFKLLDSSIQVEGLNGRSPIAYSVWEYKPVALDYETEIYSITIG